MNVFNKPIPPTSLPSAAESSLVDVAPACQALAGVFAGSGEKPLSSAAA